MSECESELYHQVQRVRSAGILVLIIVVMLALYFEADSWFWRSQIRDLQRRIATVEQDKRK